MNGTKRRGSTRRIDLGDKRDIYARERVSHLWLAITDHRCIYGHLSEHMRNKRWV